MALAYLVLALLVSLPFLFILARRPVLRRLALRNATRRPREALLVIAGSLLGAAIITGSFVVGDTLDASIRQQAKAHLGPVDELILTNDPYLFGQLRSRVTSLPKTEVDGVLPFAKIDVASAASQSGVQLAAPKTQLLAFDFGSARPFGGDPRETGVKGADPLPDHAAIGVDLARSLQIQIGDVLDVYAYGRATHLLVDRILPRRGLAGFWLGVEPEARNVLVSWDTFAHVIAPSRWRHAEQYAPPDYAVAVSNRGGVESGAKLTDEVSATLERATTGLHVSVVPVKQMALDAAEQSGKAFTEMFTSMGSFGVLAGILLLINLFVMLAAERKPELGMARAVGMRRSALVGGFATEGWLYAVTAAVLGAAAGVGLGRLIVFAFDRLLSTEHNRFELTFSLVPASVAGGFTIGLLIALLTVVGTSVRVSRLNVIRAIRDIPEPPSRSHRRWLVVGTLVTLVGLLWSASALSSQEPFALLLAPMLVLAGLVPLLGRFFGTRPTATLLAGLVVVWGALVFVLFPDPATEANIMVWVSQGIALTAAAVTVAALQQERVAAAIGKLLPGNKLGARLGLAYPLARRSRTALTVAMYALVIFILTFITTLSAMIQSQRTSSATKVAGGYDAVVWSSASNPLPPRLLRSRPDVRYVAPLATVQAEFQTGEMSSTTPWNLTAFDAGFLAGGAPKLKDRGTYPSDRAAWEAVLDDPKLVIVDEQFLQTGGGPHSLPDVGDRVRVTDPYSGRALTLTVAALSEIDYYIANGALYGERGAKALFGSRLVPSRAYVDLAPGVDAELFSTRLQGAYLEHAVEAASISELVEEAYAIWNQIFLIFQGYLALGLVVGVAGLAVVMVRAVRERRRQIGALRAIGFGSGTVGRAFTLESAFVAVEGTFIGVSLALLTLSNLVTNTDVFGDATLSVPWVSLGVLILGTITASIAATLAPAVSASRIKPAVALRITD
jgi:putative ABC transport system permease protein